MSPLMAEGVIARVHVGRPGFKVLTADDVHHATHGIRAVERRRGTLDNLDTPYVVEVHAAVVHIVHRLAGHPLAVDQEEYGVAAEAAHVERRLLTHGKAELQTGNLLYQQVLDVGGVGHLDVVERDEPGDDGRVLQCLWQIGGRDDDGFQLYRVADDRLCKEWNSWHGQSHTS